MWLVLGVLAVTFLFLLKLYHNGGKNSYSPDHWEKLGIRSIDITKVASSFELMMGQKNEVEIDAKVYADLGDEKFAGIIEAGNPILFLKDLDLAKQIMIKDFDHFVDRRILFRNAKSIILHKMLPSLEGQEWRGVRTSMSPTFTTGKMRRIMDTFNSCGKEWIAAIKSESNGSSTVLNLKHSASQFSVDVIAAGVFGLNAGSIQNSNSEFFQKALKFGDTSLWAVIKQGLALRFPNIFKFLNVETMDEGMLAFFDELFTKTLLGRESGQIGARNDFLQLLIEARKGLVKVMGSDELSAFEKEALLADAPKGQYLLDDNVIKGQAFIFIFGGIHGVAMLVTYAVHTLAWNPDILEKLRKEVDAKFQPDGTIAYDDVNSLHYLEKFVDEILRFYPITPRISRVSTKPYEDPKTGLKIPKGTFVEIPIAMFHKDPKYYPNPEKFDPENFSAERKAARHHYAYAPFGHGPRNCIGMRFALVESKAAIVHMVRNFLIDPVPSSPFPIKTRLVGQGFLIDGEVMVKLTPRTDI